MSKSCKLQKEYYSTYGNYKDVSGKYADHYVNWLEDKIIYNKKEVLDYSGIGEKRFEKNEETPTHYHSISQKDVIDFCNEYVINFNKGNVIKYLVRAGEKNGESELKDLNKALDYLKREIKFKQTLK